MGLFDINIKREMHTAKKEMVYDYFEELLKEHSEECIEKNQSQLKLEKFQVPKSLLKYNLTLSLDKSRKESPLLIEGELQNVWPLVILIAFGILLTYGVGVILVVAYVYYQKVVATRYLNRLLDDFQKKEE